MKEGRKEGLAWLAFDGRGMRMIMIMNEINWEPECIPQDEGFLQSRDINGLEITMRHSAK